ncbi:MAG TPA: G5 domain-containing protein [Jiangellales bacterium]|nr:G5 domain-containing protein [Jiangellales bacterium]
MRPAIALLAASLVVLLFGTIAAARAIMGPAGSRPPATSSGDATPLSEPSDQPAAMSPGATPPPVATTTAAATQGQDPAIEKRLVTERRAIAFDTRTVRDNTLAKGTTVVRTRGVPGVRTLAYEVTLTNGVQTAKKLVRSVVTKDPVTQVVAIGTRPGPRRHRYPRVTARRRRRQDRSHGETAAPDA